jgi:GABA(A) receptor-associated protein
MVPCDFTVGNFVTVIRNRIKVGPERSIFLFVNNTLLPMNTLLSVVYQQHHDPDNFLYLVYSSENAFGTQ